MLVLDFFTTTRKDINSEEVLGDFKTLYPDGDVEFFYKKIYSFHLWIAYKGNFEIEPFNNSTVRLIVGNLTAINDEYINHNTLQKQYLKHSETYRIEDLVKVIEGGSVQLQISNSSIEIITDLLAAIPVYKAQPKSEDIFFGSYINTVSKFSQSTSFDNVALVEFLTLGTVTYPYSLYQNIRQISPSAVSKYCNISQKFTTVYYWKPFKNNMYIKIDDAVSDINNILHKSVKKFMDQPFKRPILMSGGEDSRLLANIMKKYGDLEGYILLDEPNLELKLATKSAKNIGFDLKAFFRSKSYYFDIMVNAIRTCGDTSQYMHLHTINNKFLSLLPKTQDQKIATGYLCDAILKGSRINKNKWLKKIGIDYISNFNGIFVLSHKNHTIFKSELVEAVNIRREKLRSMELYKDLDANNEFFGFNPISNYKSSPFSSGQRRFISLYEPFASNAMIHTASRIPIKYKLNRRVFNALFKLNCSNVKFVGHTEGFFPYFGFKINFLISNFIKLKRLMFRKKGKNDGPWANYRELSSSDLVLDFVTSSDANFINDISNVHKDIFLKSLIFKNSNITNLLQIIHIENRLAKE